MASMTMTAAAAVLAAMLLSAAVLANWSPLPDGWLAPATWVVMVLLALDTLGNLASRSRFEQLVFGNATAVLVVLGAVVALSPEPA